VGKQETFEDPKNTNVGFTRTSKQQHKIPVDKKDYFS